MHSTDIFIFRPRVSSFMDYQAHKKNGSDAGVPTTIGHAEGPVGTSDAGGPRPSQVVFSALADAGVGLTDAGETVYEAVDLDAIDGLFGRETGSSVSVSFEYRDHRVVVEGDDRVRVYVRA
jgi:hypothetical protein